MDERRTLHHISRYSAWCEDEEFLEMSGLLPRWFNHPVWNWLRSLPRR